MLDPIVISPEADYPNELDWVIKLFEAGMKGYHLRKPGMTDQEVFDYLQAIPRVWRPFIVPHQCHTLVDPMKLGGWHFKDDPAQLSKVGQWRSSREEGQMMSRSIHCLDDLNEDLSCWDYVFLSPVFQSISKQNYGPQWENSQLSAALQYCKDAYRTKVYALGGVDDEHISDVGEMGFDGVALLGAIWTTRYPLESFLQVQETLNLIEQT
ncbi:MAG: thiamine phosphate synthase [Opitutales bacterium]|jgi:thiamine-phosphate pyrophosphorylase|nr:thiamine phosphate synthase [bacterium]MDG2166564.1 thiamine phosphate synthase [Opitutales bacterium]